MRERGSETHTPVYKPVRVKYQVQEDTTNTGDEDTM